MEHDGQDYLRGPNAPADTPRRRFTDRVNDTVDQWNEKAQAQDQAQAQTVGSIGNTRQHTLADEHENSYHDHHDKATKALQATFFLREHPEFDEFIQLIRSGVISI